MTQTGSACEGALMRPRRAGAADLDGEVPDARPAAASAAGAPSSAGRGGGARAVRGAGSDPGLCVAEELLRPGATPESALIDGLNRHFRAAGGCGTLISDLIRKVREIEDREREGRS